MLEKEAVGKCSRCQWPYSPHALRIPVRPKEYGENATHIEIWQSGCKCGKSVIEPIEKFIPRKRR